MPGIVVFRRRWSVGSDDLVVPAVFLAILHVIWILVLGITLAVVEFNPEISCARTLYDHVLGYVVILAVCIVLEATVAAVSMRGTILDTGPRVSMQYLLYARLVVLVVELAWLVIGVVWVSQHYSSCTADTAKKAIVGIIVCTWAVMLSVLISLWCTFDTAGRSWVKMKRYQESIKIRENRPGFKWRSGSRRRNWRHRKAMRAYEQSWDRRCKFLFCCVQEDRHRNSFTEVAKLFTEFFRDLDVVPTDVVAGLVLLRKHQKLRRNYVVSEHTNDVYQFLSGVPITPRTQFMALKNPDVLADFKNIIHYMRYALAAYGWPLYMMMNAKTGLCRIMPHLRCCVCCRCCVEHQAAGSEIIEDNCCQCNIAALQMLLSVKDVEIIYATYHVDIGETPFYVAVDHNERKIVISIRGTLSLQDVLTDLKADSEPLPVDPVQEDWMGHKGMVQAAVYIRKKIKEEMLLSLAFGKDLDRGTQQYDIVCVGHSLGAGTAAILAILLHQEYPNLQCYSYSPPGGLLSATCIEDTKHFITSVIVGKDVVPRIGLHQLETLRQDLINVIKQSHEPKWKTIAGSMLCCCDGGQEQLTGSMYDIYEKQRSEKENRSFAHPSDSQIALTSHTPLFLPGKIIHIVRNHPKDRSLCKRSEPVYQAIWADNRDFDEVLISPTMVNDHMPDNVLEALEKVLTNVSPAKPTRKRSESERKALLSSQGEPFCPECNVQDINHTHRLTDESTHLHSTPEDVIQPTNVSQLNASNAVFNMGSETNSLTWDYATLPTDQSRRHPPPPEVCRAERTKSYPPPLQKLKPGVKLDIFGNPEWTGSTSDVLAPLASPETLSEASSVDTVNSKRFSDSFQRLQSLNFPKLKPIPPSPQQSPRDETCQYRVPASSPVDFDPIHADDFPILGSCVRPMAQSTPIKPDYNPSAQSTESTLVDLSQQVPHQGRNSDSGSSGDLGVSLLPDSIIHMPEANETNLTDIENRIAHKMQDIDANDPYRLTYGDLTAETTGSQESFALHSPDSASNQCIYSEGQGHYSPAGRGYPHGAYMNECVEEPQVDDNVQDGEDALSEHSSEHSTECRDFNHVTPPAAERPSTMPSCIPEVIITDSSPCEPEPDSDCPLVIITAPDTDQSDASAEQYTPHMSRSSSDESLPETDAACQPLIEKRASWTSSGSQCSQRSLTNGHSTDSSDDRSGAEYSHSYEDQSKPPRAKVTCVTLADGHSGFGETYFV